MPPSTHPLKTPLTATDALGPTATASEVLRARRHGLKAVKFFPAGQIGGVPALTSMAAAIPDMRFVPTGPDDVPRYLASPAVLAVGGTWMAPRDLLVAGDWERVRERCELAARIAAQSSAP
jgi:2-dehydro-3-deoxyphosphogluconate aldolase/(4S)-4-hydroxy-2-oxoglutarate aldolase